MMSQREAVYAAVVAVLGREPKGEKVQDILTSDQLKQVHAIVVQAFVDRKVELKDSATKPRTTEYITKYVPGLVNNWLRKDINLNGGAKYEAKRPGSRTGSGDEMLQAMRSLLAITKDADAKASIEREIEARKAQLEAAKVKPINVAHLPESLRSLAERIAPTVRKASEQ
jgi:uncharacterized protein with PIN domain